LRLNILLKLLNIKLLFLFTSVKFFQLCRKIGTQRKKKKEKRKKEKEKRKKVFLIKKRKNQVFLKFR